MKIPKTSMIVLLAGFAAAGCVSSSKTVSGPCCELHNVPLKAGVAPVVYGLLGLDDKYWEAKKSICPNSASFVIGGCSERPEKVQAVAYCEKCRELDPVQSDKIASDGVGELAGRSPPLEIEIQLIAYAASEIAELSKGGPIAPETLLALHQKGKGNLVCVPKAVTQVGQEAIVKSVEEVIYPTDFFADAPTNLPAQSASNAIALVPCSFETREVGVRLVVMPKATIDPAVLELTINFDLVADPTWREYTTTCKDSSGREYRSQLSMPFFFDQSFYTSIPVPIGRPTICAGGLESRDKTSVGYAFVTVRRPATREQDKLR